MSKLAALKKQIAVLEAQAERIAKAEMTSAIAKIRDIMSEFNLTIEHLSQSVAGKRAAKKTKTKTKTKTASVAKYVDPKTGKTWSGFGRAPGWIAGAKNREAFLAAKNVAADSAAKTPASAKKVAAKATKAVKAAKKGVASAAKKAVAAGKKTAAGKKASAKKSAPKKVGSKRVAAAAIDPTATQAS